MRYEKAARSPRFFNNERYPSQSSCGLLWSARVRYGSVSRSGLRRPCARAAAPYRHTRMRLSAACPLSACRAARSQMHAKGYRHLRLDCMHPHPHEPKSFLVRKGRSQTDRQFYRDLPPRPPRRSLTPLHLGVSLLQRLTLSERCETDVCASAHRFR